MGLDEDFYSVSIPLGATINMDGAAVTITVFALAVGFIIGVVQDSVETALNSSSDVFFTATAEEFDRKEKRI